MAKQPTACEFCGFANPVGGVAQVDSRVWVCPLCARLPGRIGESGLGEALVGVLHRSLNLLRQDLQALQAQVTPTRRRQPRHAREVARLQELERQGKLKEK